MSKRQLPSTSLEAFHSQNPEHISKQYSGILGALKVLKFASAEQIADYLKIQHVVVNRRVSEMERLGMIWRPGAKTKTKTGRSAYCWQMCSDQTTYKAPIEK